MCSLNKNKCSTASQNLVPNGQQSKFSTVILLSSAAWGVVGILFSDAVRILSRTYSFSAVLELMRDSLNTFIHSNSLLSVINILRPVNNKASCFLLQVFPLPAQVSYKLETTAKKDVDCWLFSYACPSPPPHPRHTGLWLLTQKSYDLWHLFTLEQKVRKTILFKYLAFVLSPHGKR